MSRSTINLLLGGLNVKIRSSGKLPFAHDPRFKPFQTAGAYPDITLQFQLIRAFWDSPKNRSPIERPSADRAICPEGEAASFNPPRMRDDPKETESQRDWSVSENRQGSCSMIDFKKNRVWQFFESSNSADLSHHGVGPALLAPLMPNFYACFLHAAAIVRRGRAAVFLAPDEGGKTTAVRLSASGTILGDDQVLVRRARGRFRVWGTPWGLHVDARANAPLAGLFLLKKGKRFSLAPLAARELIPFIWGEIQNPLAILPKPLKQKSFAILCDIARSAPCWTMSFSKNHIDWDAVDRALAKQVGNTKNQRTRPAVYGDQRAATAGK